MSIRIVSGVAFVVMLAWCAGAVAADRPNIVLIMADDMGYSDIGCYGGEIRTPHLDALASNGLRFTQFYNTARCCPTRASLLTGLHPHQTGIGHMTNRPGKAEFHDHKVFGYRGFLNRHCVTIAEVLREAGYATMMAGKWHVGYHGREKWPLQRGFDRYYGIISGASNYFRPGGSRGLTLDNDAVEPEGDGYYTTDAFTTHAIDFVREAVTKDADRPFFLYLAYTAPHWPLHAPQADIDRYKGRYLAGWDRLRAARYARMVEMGLISPSTPLSAVDARPWDSLAAEQQREMDLRMAIYAAQVDRMDQNIGRLVAMLSTLGELDNTLIMFLSDNGGCAEGGELGGGAAEELESDRGFMLSYGRAWANMSNTPFRRYKHWVHEGGIATPLIVHWPARISRTGELRAQPGYLPDIMATCVEVSGAMYPSRFHDNEIPRMEGMSLVAAFEGEPLPERPMFWEHEQNRAVRVGDWKLVSAGRDGDWELYDLSVDRSETTDLAGKFPLRVELMADLWEQWAWRCRVLPDPRRKSAPGR